MVIFNRKPKHHFFFGNESVGGFNIEIHVNYKDIKKCYVDITTTSGVFSMRVSDYTFGYLLAAAEQGKDEEIHAYAAMQYYIACGIYTDEGLAQDIVKAITKHQKRLEKKAKADAKAVTPEMEQADEAFMDSVVEYANATPKERKAMRKEEMKIAKDIIEGKDEV